VSGGECAGQEKRKWTNEKSRRGSNTRQERENHPTDRPTVQPGEEHGRGWGTRREVGRRKRTDAGGESANSARVRCWERTVAGKVSCPEADRGRRNPLLYADGRSVVVGGGGFKKKKKKKI